jgi:hypothetical protein
MSYIYLASAYTGPHSLMEARYLLACNAAAEIVSAGIAVYSPIAHWHEPAIQYSLPKSADFWWHQNKMILMHAVEVWVYTYAGWDKSSGVKQEVDFAQAAKIPVRYSSNMEPLIRLFYEEHPTLVRN